MKLTLFLLAFTFGCPVADAAILHTISDELSASASSQISVTHEPVRGGKAAFRHVARANGAAAEFVIPAAGGDVQWYGWSTQLPADFDHRERSTLLMQLTGASREKPTQCPVAASSLEINPKGQMVFHLHTRAEEGAEPKCRPFTLAADVGPTRGQWFDFVLHAKWTNDPSGFVELWIKRHDNNFFHVVDYRGPTCAAGERGPEFRLGAHVMNTGEPPAEAKTDVVVLTDELRVGDVASSFDDVAPPGAARRATEAKRGKIQYVLYGSELNRRKIPIMIYTPPGYDANGTQRFPVVYHLHGAGGGSPERQWIKVSATLTGAMDSAAIPPTIYVFVNGLGDTGFVDHPDPQRMPKVFSSIITELIPFIDANYRTIADRRGRAVDGFSMGGGGAAMLATKRPDLFCAAVAYGGAFIPHNPDDPNENRRRMTAEFSPYVLVPRRTDEIREGVRFRLVCGDQDKNHALNLKDKAFLESLNIPVSWVSIPGVGHDTKELFDRVGVESLKFMHEALAKE